MSTIIDAVDAARSAATLAREAIASLAALKSAIAVLRGNATDFVVGSAAALEAQRIVHVQLVPHALAALEVHGAALRFANAETDTDLKKIAFIHVSMADLAAQSCKACEHHGRELAAWAFERAQVIHQRAAVG